MLHLACKRAVLCANVTQVRGLSQSCNLHLDSMKKLTNPKDNCIFAVNSEYTSACCDKYSSKLDISRSLMRIFDVNLEYTSARGDKYSSKLDISRSLIRIFAKYYKVIYLL